MQTRNKTLIKKIGERFRRVRLQLGLSPKEIAGTLGLQPSGYRKNETGINAPGLDTLGHMLKEHGISPNWLLFEAGPMCMESPAQSPGAPEAEPEVQQEPETQAESLHPMDADTRELFEAMTRDRGLHYEILAHYYRCRKEPNPSSASTVSPVPH